MVKRHRFNLRTESNDEEFLSDISDISCPESEEIHKSKPRTPKKTRHKYTHTQDMSMLKYIMNENRYNEIKGVALWKDMEGLKITNHSKQSMKYRFINTVIPHLHQYNIPKRWVDKLSYMFPEIRKKNVGKENSKDNFPLCSMLDKWERQVPVASSSPRNHANDGEKKTTKERDDGSTADKQKGSDIEEHDSESTIPYTEVTTPHRSIKRQKYKKALKIQSSSESEDEGEKDVSAAASANSPEPSPSKSGEDCSKEDNCSEKSDLSDYDKYLVGIAKNNSSSKKTPKSDKSVLQSDKANTTNEDIEPDSEEDTDECDTTSVTEDRRSRLQHRRHLKRIEKGDLSSPSTSSHKKTKKTKELTQSEPDKVLNEDIGEAPNPSTSSHKNKKKANLALFVTESQPDSVLNEDIDDASRENTSTDLSEYETIISDIAQSYGLTNREVLSTIFSFNGNIDKTIAYIKLGPELCHLKPWSKEEDDILSSTSEEGIKEIAQRRGKKLIADRLQFLENFTEDLAG